MSSKTPKRQPTTDAVEILHRRYFEGKPEMLAMLEEARVEDEIARKIYALRTKAGLTQRACQADWHVGLGHWPVRRCRL